MGVSKWSFWVIVFAVCAFGCTRLHAPESGTSSGDGDGGSTIATGSGTTATDDTADQGGGGDGGADATGGAGGDVDTTTSSDTSTVTNTGTTTGTETDSGTTTSTTTDTTTNTETDVVCPYTDNQKCDEPEGSNLCPEGTDVNDCVVVGRLKIQVAALDQSCINCGSPATLLRMYGQGAHYGETYDENAYPNGGPGFNVFKEVGHFEFDVEPGEDVLFNGLTNPSANGQWWCVGPLTPTVIVVAFWNSNVYNPNSLYVPAIVTLEDNGNQGCNFKATAVAAPIAMNDKDGDGYTTDNQDQSLKDCDDSSSLIHPGQLETWGDSLDVDCNGQADPPSWKYTVKGGLIVGKVNVELVDANSWSDQINGFATAYPMVWNAATSAFEVSVGNWKAPTNYVVRYKLSAADVLWQWTPWNQGGACQPDGVTFQVSESEYGTIVPFTMTLADQCHLHKQ